MWFQSAFEKVSLHITDSSVGMVEALVSLIFCFFLTCNRIIYLEKQFEVESCDLG